MNKDCVNCMHRDKTHEEYPCGVCMHQNHWKELGENQPDLKDYIIDELEIIKRDITSNLCFKVECSDCPFDHAKGCGVADFIDCHIMDLKGCGK